MKITYLPSRDELKLEIVKAKGKPNKKLGPFKLWWDAEGNITTIAIANYTKELENFGAVNKTRGEMVRFRVKRGVSKLVASLKLLLDNN